ncbi:hypothetical protein SDC9_129958 [bioreactor metagenome]|uniref:Uncharacterized protein n=1 Tax=bioreactor metagenome TaxID=1076179 RepID=A0A645D0F1_9ZZZZ
MQGAQLIGPARGVLPTGHKAAGATAAEDAQPLFIIAARDAVGVIIPGKCVAAHAVLPQIKREQRRNFRLTHPGAAAHGKHRALAAALLQRLGQWANQLWEDHIGFVDMSFINVDFISRHIPMGNGRGNLRGLPAFQRGKLPQNIVFHRIAVHKEPPGCKPAQA